jgi:DNA-binding SARP family transcriptional activator
MAGSSEREGGTVDLHFRVLGPMEIADEGHPVALPGAAERALLVQLLLSPGRTLPATLLVDRLWSESSLPADPMNALQIRVSKLRRALKSIGRLPGQRRSQGGRRHRLRDSDP